MKNLTAVIALSLLATACDRKDSNQAAEIPSTSTATSSIAPTPTVEAEIPAEPSVEIPAESPVAENEEKISLTDKMKAVIERGTLSAEKAEKYPPLKVGNRLKRLLKTQTTYLYDGRVALFAEHVLYIFDVKARTWIQGPKSEFKKLLRFVPLRDNRALLISQKRMQIYYIDKDYLYEIKENECHSRLSQMEGARFFPHWNKMLVVARNKKKQEFEFFDLERDCFQGIEKEEAREILLEQSELRKKYLEG